MIEEEGKCRAEAEARGLPGEKSEKRIGNRNVKEEEDTECEKIPGRKRIMRSDHLFYFYSNAYVNIFNYTL